MQRSTSMSHPEDQEKLTQTAKSPFDREDADVILRSTDNVDFHLHKQVLSISSPFFKDLFSLEQPPTTDGRELFSIIGGKHIPVVSVTEEGETLDSLFRMIYPTDWTFTELGLLGNAIAAARKYQMIWPEDRLTQALTTCVEDKPFSVYSVACGLGLEEIAKLAARSALAKNLLNKPELPYYDIMDGRVTAGQYFRLIRLHSYPAQVTHFVRPFQIVESRSQSTVDSPMSSPELIAGPERHSSSYVLSGHHCSSIPGDLVVCSSDGVHIMAHRMILAMCSPILEGLITGASQVDEAGLPMIFLDDTGSRLIELFTLCYPFGNFTTHDLDALKILLEGGMKYQMKGVIQLARKSLTGLEEYHSDRLRIYCLAVKYRWQKEATEIGASFAALPIAASRGYCPEMEDIPAWPYRALRMYHVNCRTELSKLKNFVNFERCREQAASILNGFTFDPKL